MRILWASNYTTQSGYSTQARLHVPALQRGGHQVTVAELGVGGMPRRLGDVQIVPTVLDPLGSDILPAHAQRLRSDAVLTLVDVWGLRTEVMGQLPWFPLTPVDHTPVPPAITERLKVCQAPIAISRFGAQELRKAGFSPYYVPHMVDSGVFRPADQSSARREVNMRADRFWVSFVGVNDSVPSRKGIPELLAAWSMFSPRHPDARLYLHTAVEGNLPVNNLGGVRIDLLMSTFGVDPNTVTLANAYEYRTGIPQRYLANVYAGSDVLVLPSRGEGFGLPLLEAQRSGCPVITTDFAAGAELCASGWLVEYEPTWSWQSAVSAQPGIASIYERLEQAYAERGNPRYRLEAVEFAREYDVDVVSGRYLLPAMRDIAERVLDALRVG